MFVTPQLLNSIAEQTNEKARRKYEEKVTAKSREWWSTTGIEISGFLGVLLISGLYKLPRTTDHWNINPDKPLVLLIQKAFSVKRWEQIKRFFKNSSYDSDYDEKKAKWYTKLNP